MALCWRGAGDVVCVQKWQSGVLDTEFLLELVDARTEGPRFKTFVTYSLVSTLCPSGVRRRYSDFEWLREMLKFRFHGAAQAARRHPLCIAEDGDDDVPLRPAPVPQVLPSPCCQRRR